MRNLFTILLTALTSLAFSCTCDPLPPISKELCDEYEVIFRGKVIALDSCEEMSTAHFRIDELFKGELSQESEIHFDCASSCQMSFAIGEEWLIYARYFKFGKIEVHFCSRSRKYFEDPVQDFNTTVRQLTYEEELNFLKENYSVQAFREKEVNVIPERSNKRTRGIEVLWWLLGSAGGFLLIRYFFNRFVK